MYCWQQELVRNLESNPSKKKMQIKNQSDHPDRTACWTRQILRGAYPENT